jgi:hypothetical protein
MFTGSGEVCFSELQLIDNIYFPLHRSPQALKPNGAAIKNYTPDFTANTRNLTILEPRKFIKETNGFIKI